MGCDGKVGDMLSDVVVPTGGWVGILAVVVLVLLAVYLVLAVFGRR